jgi:predicted RNase H-like nuclease (RuvC/YqgF family)
MWGPDINYEDAEDPIQKLPNPIHELAVLRTELITLKSKNESLKIENSDLLQKLHILEKMNYSLNSLVDIANREATDQTAQIYRLQYLNSDLQDEVVALKKELKVNKNTKQVALEWETKYNLACRELSNVEDLLKKFLLDILESKHKAGDEFYFDYIEPLNDDEE